MKPRLTFYIGLLILGILTITNFIKIQVDSGVNYITSARLLSLLIFSNPFILGIYILISIILIYTGIKAKK